jgi:hypothetical protein
MYKISIANKEDTQAKTGEKFPTNEPPFQGSLKKMNNC